MGVESLMRLNLANLPQDTALLQQLVRDLVAEKDRSASEIEKLRLIIRQLQRGQFGRRSERLDPGQLQLGLEELDADMLGLSLAGLALPTSRQSPSRSPPSRLARASAAGRGHPRHWRMHLLPVWRAAPRDWCDHRRDAG